MIQKFIGIVTSVLLLVSQQAKSQTVNTKWGKPTQEELTMTEYAADKDANAVELYRLVDVSYSILNGDFRLTHRVKCRLKVLKPAGRKVADVNIPLRVSENSPLVREMVMGLKAVAYNLEDGKVVKTKMESQMVNEEQVDKTQKVVKFSVPQVRVGTVIEYEYRIESDFFYDLRDWYAQSDIPVRWTRYILSVPEWFKFNIEETGMTQLQCTKETGRLSTGETSISTTETTFTGEYLPALNDDDFVWCARDYGCKVTHELRGIYVPGAVYKDYSTRWDDVDMLLLEDGEFGGRIKKSSPLKDDIIASGIAALPDMEQRAAAVWQLLRSRVRWNGEYKFWANSSSKVLKEGTGSNADMNFLYINMLHDAGIESFPVVLRLRDRGRLPLTHASLKYLSTFVVGILLNDSTLAYMDGSAEDGYLNVLPSRLLVSQARTVRKGQSGQWVDLQGASHSKSVTMVQATLDPSGIVSGKSVTRYIGQSAARLRHRWRTSADSTSLIQAIQEEDGIEISAYQLEGRHDFTPTVRETIHFTKQCDTAGDLIYLNPMLLSPMGKSPFTTASRDLPVAFPYSQHTQFNFQLTLPDGWHVEDMPKPIMLKLDGITARIVYILKGSMLTTQYRIDISRTFFDHQQYADLKALFDQLVESNKQVLTLKKQS